MAVQKHVAPDPEAERPEAQDPVDIAAPPSPQSERAEPPEKAPPPKDDAPQTTEPAFAPETAQGDALKATVSPVEPLPASPAAVVEAEPSPPAPLTEPQAGPEPENQGPTIVQVVPRLNAGGVERGTIEIAEAIAVAGGRAIVVSEGGRLEPELAAAGGELVRMPVASKNPFIVRRNAGRLRELIQERRVDLIHARSRAPAWSAYWAAKKAKIPFVTTYHGVYDESLPLKRFYNSVMARGEVIIAISHQVAELVKDRYGAPPERVVTIHRGADLRRFSEEAATMDRVAALAAHWGVFHEARPILLFPGRLTRWKGQALFLEALAKVKNARGPNGFIALLVGGASDDRRGQAYRAELNQMIHDQKLEGVARMVGHCDDMPAAYRLASAVVTASLEPEAFGRTVVEAMAMGAPVIAPAHGGALETVDDDVTGWLFEAGDADSLAMAVEHVLDIGPDGRQAAGIEGVKRARTHFSVEQMQAATIEAYMRVLDL